MQYHSKFTSEVQTFKLKAFMQDFIRSQTEFFHQVNGKSRIGGSKFFYHLYIDNTDRRRNQRRYTVLICICRKHTQNADEIQGARKTYDLVCTILVIQVQFNETFFQVHKFLHLFTLHNNAFIICIMIFLTHIADINYLIMRQMIKKNISQLT